MKKLIAYVFVATMLLANAMAFDLSFVDISQEVSRCSVNVNIASKVDCSVPESKVAADVTAGVSGDIDYEWTVNSIVVESGTIAVTAGQKTQITRDLDPYVTNAVSIKTVLDAEDCNAVEAYARSKVSACDNEVPEFGTIGAAIALFGAGFVAYKKRK